MKERGLLCDAGMVRAYLDGRKTQTRRIMDRQPSTVFGKPCFSIDVAKCAAGEHNHELPPSPYGVVGDRLWVRETWGVVNGCDHYSIKDIPAAARVPVYRADGEGNRQMWRSSRFMPRWASRITLELTGVRVELVAEISEEDAKAEGCHYQECNPIGKPQRSYRAHFAALWDSINGKGAWERNDWVWVLTTKKP